MVDEFEVGKKYVCTLKTRPIYFNNCGNMDYMLSGKPFTVKSVFEKDNVLFEEDPSKRVWFLHLEDFEEYKPRKLVKVLW